MSDPVTNVEIEDVLSSIRRLVAEGDKTGRPANIAGTAAPREAERFVLTPALRIADAPVVEDDVSETLNNDDSSDSVSQTAASDAEPLVLEPAAMLGEAKIHDRMSDSERASLEATIAELEAAVTYQPDEWEPDGSEMAPTTGLAAAFAALEAEDGIAHERVVTLRPQAEPTFRHTPSKVPVEDDVDTDYGDDLRVSDDDDEGTPIPDDLDETLAAYIAGGSALDRDEIRQMVVDVVRQELQGELGERITRNVRKLVRLEIQRAATTNLYD